MSEDQFDYEVTRERWYEEQDKDAKWIEEQEAITQQDKEIARGMEMGDAITFMLDKVLGGK